MSKLRTVQIHQSLHRPVLLGGGERKLTLLNAILLMATVFGVGSLQAAAVGLVFSAFFQWALILLAKKDPKFSEVYMRHVSYQSYYPSQSSHSGSTAILQKNM